MKKAKPRNIATPKLFASPKIGEDASPSAMTVSAAAAPISLSARLRSCVVRCMFNAGGKQATPFLDRRSVRNFACLAYGDIPGRQAYRDGFKHALLRVVSATVAVFYQITPGMTTYE